jgi:hypothetical protein
VIRDRVQLQLNRGESRHELVRQLFFANQGAFRTGDYEEVSGNDARPAKDVNGRLPKINLTTNGRLAPCCERCHDDRKFW